MDETAPEPGPAAGGPGVGLDAPRPESDPESDPASAREGDVESRRARRGRLLREAVAAAGTANDRNVPF